VGGVGAVEHSGSFLPGLLGGAVVDVGGGVQAQAGVVMFVVVPGENVRQNRRAASIESNRSGKSGRYLSVLNWASL
jgi:hypothetical protein